MSIYEIAVRDVAAKEDSIMVGCTSVRITKPAFGRFL